MIDTIIFILLLPLIVASLLFLLCVAILLFIVFSYLLTGLVLHLMVWFFWCRCGRYVLLVYSDSPIWQGFFETNILPRLGERAVVLNWSHRNRWRFSLAVRVFWYFAGPHDFNPIALVFRPFRRTRQFRFYQPFRQFKHGRTDAVTNLEHALYQYVDEVSGVSST